ncbi:mammalian cell entry protein, partial [Mycobacterium scrofulaceum]|uniref:mammalian cell entry protein n=1 Tax=Mycobacterium scrofulaceum TaxID=1783 RepID=UPI000AE9359F
MTAEPTTTARARRRASRAAGPAKPESSESATVQVDAAPAQPAKPVKTFKSLKPPPRRQPHRALVAWISFAAALLAIGALAGCLAVLVVQQRHANAQQARDQRFVDTATQTVVNMFSYKQDNIDDSVNRFVNGTSGPLRGMLGANNNVENLKAIFRSTNATSEAVINGAALEGIEGLFTPSMSATVTRTDTSTEALSVTLSMPSRAAPLMTASDVALVERKIALR